MSVVIHEVAHGYAALYFGDRTAKDMGRLTLNPIPHLDMIGSILLPGFLAITGSSFMIGWAKPVPYNVDNLTKKRLGTLVVASAGILVNFLIAIIFGLILRFSLPYGPSESFLFIVSTITIINLALGIFNLTPIPPLDGSKIIFSLLPSSFYRFVNFVEQYAIVLFLAFIFFFSGLLYPVLNFLFKLITGIGL